MGMHGDYTSGTDPVALPPDPPAAESEIPQPCIGGTAVCSDPDPRASPPGLNGLNPSSGGDVDNGEENSSDGTSFEGGMASSSHRHWGGRVPAGDPSSAEDPRSRRRQGGWRHYEGSGVAAAAVVSSPVCMTSSSANLLKPWTISYLYNLAIGRTN